MARRSLANDPSATLSARWQDVFWRVYAASQSDRVMLIAAGVSFYGLFALFPATAALVSLYGLFADASTIRVHLILISGFLPQGAIEVIGDQITHIAAQGQGTLGAAFVGTLALSFWGATAGTKAIFDALNIIYKEEEKRSFIALTLQAFAFTAGGLVLVLLVLAGIVVVPIAFKLLGISDQSGAALLTLLRWPLLYLLIVVGLSCLYRFGPSRTTPQRRWVNWGCLLASIVWLVGSLMLSWYMANFGSYNATYGALGAVIGFMIWMWLSTIVVLVGGEINAELERGLAIEAQPLIEEQQ